MVRTNYIASMAHSASTRWQVESVRPPATGVDVSTLWSTVLADLRERLDAGEFAERFPSDRELMAYYGVSRHTVREAVRRLAVVDRRPRLGGRIRKPTTALRTLLETLAKLGVRTEPSTVTTRKRRSTEVAERLEHRPGTHFTVQTCVLRADGEPLICLELWSPRSDSLPEDLAAALVDMSRPVPDELELVEQRTIPVNPEAAVCDELRLSHSTPTFCIEARFDLGKDVTLWQRAFIRHNCMPCALQLTVP